MKNFSFLVVILILFSCNNDDDNNNDSPFINADLSKNFLLGEKWFIDSAIGDKEVDFNGNGTKSTNLKEQVETCVSDNFYIFEQNQPDLVVINESDLVCANFDEQYGPAVFDFEILAADELLEFTASPFDLLGGFKDVFFLGDLEFLISRDSSFKILKGTFRTTIDGESVNVTYSLIANANDRP